MESKKRTKTHRIVVKTNSFIRFLEEFTAWQFAFEINWPLTATIIYRRARHNDLGIHCSKKFFCFLLLTITTIINILKWIMDEKNIHIYNLIWFEQCIKSEQIWVRVNDPNFEIYFHHFFTWWNRPIVYLYDVIQNIVWLLKFR